MTVRVAMWTDGSCPLPGGPGGYAAILLAVNEHGEVLKRREVLGGDDSTTNNRMELHAVVSGLATMTRPTTVTVYTDSRYVMDPFVEGWIYRWRARGWRRVKNLDLWLTLHGLVLDRHDVTWEHVYGHTGVVLNEEADVLAGHQTKLRQAAIANVMR